MQRVGGASVGYARRGFVGFALVAVLAMAPQVRAACDCGPGYPFLADTKIRFNNDSIVVGNVGVNQPGGLLRFGRSSCQGASEVSPCTGNTTYNAADTILVGELTSVAGTESNVLKLGPGAIVRNPPLLTVSLPLVGSSVCGAFTDVTCGGASVLVPAGGMLVGLPPGSYDALRMGNGSEINLQAGTYSFCNVKVGSGSVVNADPATVLNVEGKFSLGAGVRAWTSQIPPYGTPFVLNVEGRLVRLSQDAWLVAEVRAPNAKLKQQRAAILRGCSCTAQIVSDKNTKNICTSNSPSGAFVD